MNKFSENFIEGVKDCEEGIEHKTGKPQAYDRGYSTEYTRQENACWMSQQQPRMNRGRTGGQGL